MQQMHDFLCEQLKIKQPWVDYPRIENAILKCEELMEDEAEVIEEVKEVQIGTRFSAIDWLASNLPTIDWEDPHYKEILSKAKEMEERELKDAVKYFAQDA